MKRLLLILFVLIYSMTIKAQFVRVYDKYRVDLTHTPAELKINYGEDIDSVILKTKIGLLQCDTVVFRQKTVILPGFKYVFHSGDKPLDFYPVLNVGYNEQRRVDNFACYFIVGSEAEAIKLRNTLSDYYIRRESLLDKRTNIITRLIDFSIKEKNKTRDGFITYKKMNGEWIVEIFGCWKYKIVTDYDS